MSNPLDLDATAQAELVRAGKISATELVNLAIAAVERVNPQLNAVIHPRFERARDEAKAAGGGAFAGVP
ncbi:MAG: hypothetical protein NWS59_06335, partial [Ilumatobacteraceae bacterium]|nr:hypothetical protein [Ilumatobacteraceae bacterium]